MEHLFACRRINSICGLEYRWEIDRVGWRGLHDPYLRCGDRCYKADSERAHNRGYESCVAPRRRSTRFREWRSFGESVGSYNGQVDALVERSCVSDDDGCVES